MDLFYLLDNCELWASRKIMFESFDAIRISFNMRFDCAVGPVLNVTDHLMSGSGALAEKAIPDSLYVATNYEPSRHRHFHSKPPTLAEIIVRCKFSH
jgi:hypothetical protein